MPIPPHIPGLFPKLWTEYPAELVGFNILTGTPTQTTNPTGTNYAAYYDDPSGLTFVKFRFAFDANTTFGTSNIWAVRLPKIANRATGGADLVNSTAMAWKGSAANPQINVALRPSLMDPMINGGNQGMEDYFIQFFCPYLLAMGTWAMTSGVGVATVTHGLATTPNAYDIGIQLTNQASTAPGEVWVDTIGATTFAVNVRSTATTTPQTGTWKARVEPNGSTTLDILSSPLKPWAFASGHELSGSIFYEAQV